MISARSSWGGINCQWQRIMLREDASVARAIADTRTRRCSFFLYGERAALLSGLWPRARAFFKVDAH